MIKVSATKLRNNLFAYLDKAEEGEIIVIERKKKEVARIISTRQIDWRDKMNLKPELLIPPEEFIKPIDDIWEDYV